MAFFVAQPSATGAILRHADHCPDELEVSVFVSVPGLPVGLRDAAPSYSELLSVFGVVFCCAPLSLGWLLCGCFCVSSCCEISHLK